jgi:very-short-patch-repair endonuclease
MNHNYNKQLKNLAREKRNTMTKGEIILWKHVLRANHLGVGFKRQRPMGNFILDFYAPEINLAIEVDGYSHRFDQVHIKDQQKDRWLLENGIQVLHIPDVLIFDDLENVERMLRAKVEELLQTAVLPPAPSKRGGGRFSD